MQKTSEKFLVSVLIGTYNRSELLERCLEHVFSQKQVEVEVIVVDDASTDDTFDVVKSFKEYQSGRLKYLRNGVNRGISFNSNRAFQLSSGKYLALVGDDDYWLDEFKLRKQIEVFESDNDNLAIVGTWWSEKGNTVSKLQTPVEPKNWKSKMLVGGGVICGSTPLIKRSAWVSVGGFDENLKRGTDSDLFRRIILNNYTARMLYEVTTVVDIEDNRPRMTPVNNLEALRHARENHVYTFRKYRRHFLLHPIATTKRLKKMFNIELKVIRLQLKNILFFVTEKRSK